MTIETWLAFVAASAVVLAVPGPTILLVIGQSLGTGRRGAAPLVVGVALGDLTAITLSLAGLGAVLAASATGFTIVKWLGAAYLVWLGVALWRAPVPDSGTVPAALPARRAMRDAYVVTALNPKSIAFFIAFVPQFVAREAAFAPQAAILIATFVAMAAANAALYALLAGRLAAIVRRPAMRRMVNRMGGTMLIGAGVATAAMRRA